MNQPQVVSDLIDKVMKSVLQEQYNQQQQHQALLQQQNQFSQISSQPAQQSTPATAPDRPQVISTLTEPANTNPAEQQNSPNQNTDLDVDSKQEVSISNVQVEARVSVGDNQRKENWSTRKYVMQPFASTMHIRIAYYVNNQITKRENQDPLEYFKKYRTAPPQ